MHTFHCAYGEYPPQGAEEFEYTETTKRVRRFFEDFIPEQGRAPGIPEIMKALDLDQQETWDALYQLHLGVQIMFVPGTENIVKMPPVSFVPTRHRAKLEDGREFWAGCAGEASAFHFRFPGQVTTIESMCPDCWEPIVTKWKDGELLSVEPETALIHIGRHPGEWGDQMMLTCENINFFRSPEHVKVWEEKMPEKRGITLPVDKAVEWVEGEARVRYWDYDRPPGLVGANSLAGSTVEHFRALGADVTYWEELLAAQSAQ
ncbi:alkylmercury lyase family protein [Arthrobacter sp. I2-34]|uniref:Alkylmercury lyase family protein n=1 Tax=Arthrobacter hankyongi TaxID=2904801 RepID=A0ABS9L3H9_9MICC|nr:organomercurial lyase [Arthrobacter hankyongi]MCG2621218.1 alkylmercury lyase family protein [Arthrobacter hankyongi]